MDDRAAATADAALHAELDLIESAWAEAMVSNDADRIAAFITADWVLVSESGITSAAQFLALVASGALTHSAMASTGASRVRAHGGTAVLTVRVISTATYRGQRATADEWTTDVFVEGEGRWLCALTHITAASPS